jgi:hypothetical protein
VGGGAAEEGGGSGAATALKLQLEGGVPPRPRPLVLEILGLTRVIHAPYFSISLAVPRWRRCGGIGCYIYRRGRSTGRY